jgi:hypothetical protein
MVESYPYVAIGWSSFRSFSVTLGETWISYFCPFGFKNAAPGESNLHIKLATAVLKEAVIWDLGPSHSFLQMNADCIVQCFWAPLTLLGPLFPPSCAEPLP